MKTPAVRLRRIDRSLPLPDCSLDEALPDDHPVRIVWQYVCAIDLSAFLARVRAVAGRPGRDSTDPALLLALWMFATIDGVGSARELRRLCHLHLAYRWLRGGVSVNYHTLADFRARHEAQLDELLVDHVSALVHHDLIQLKGVAQDGVRIRADAGAGSFHRVATIEEAQRQVEQQLQALKRQDGEALDAVARRQRAARQRHARAKQERLRQALQVAKEQQALRDARARAHPREAATRYGGDAKKAAGRASTTDPEARSMKMADGGTRPAYNVQCATTTAGGIVVAVDVTNVGSDGGLMGPMIDRIEADYGMAPRQVLVDGGYSNVAQVEEAHVRGIEVYTPLKNEAKDAAVGQDPYAAKPQDNEGMATLRRRMGTAEAKAVYRQRAATAEWVNAGLRNRGLYQMPVRGLRKVRAVVLLHALVHNLKQTLRICRAKKPNQDWRGMVRARAA